MSTNYIRQVTDNASTPVTHDILESVDTRIFRATCSTTENTATKVATLDDGVNFSLTKGVRVFVTFSAGNTADTPSLRVDGSTTGTAKTIVYKTGTGTQSTGGGNTLNTWGANETVLFTYDGTYWVNGGSGLTISNAYYLANGKQSPASTLSGYGITDAKIDNGTITLGSNSITPLTSETYTGTVTQVSTGAGLTGGPVTTSGTIKANLNSETSLGTIGTTSGLYAVGVDSNGKLAVSVTGTGTTVQIVRW